MAGLLAMSLTAQAQSAREHLTDLTAQLQKAPADEALREKIITLALTLHPNPATPDAAIMAEGAAEYAFKNAKVNSDFSDAAKQYEKALLLAPWLAADYFNCGVAHEKAGEIKEAIRNFSLYPLAAPNADDLQAVKKRIGGLQYATQKAEDETSRPAREAGMREAAGKEADERAGLTDNQDGTVTDHKTKLTWQKDDDVGKRSWFDSTNYCRGLSLAGHSDWRLPNKEEWTSYWDNAGSKEGIRERYFPNAKASYYWSSWSSPSDGAAYAGRYWAGDGTVESGSKSFIYYARCLRN
jgi:tetratricopeptide (TPR) repeat protein